MIPFPLQELECKLRQNGVAIKPTEVSPNSIPTLLSNNTNTNNNNNVNVRVTSDTNNTDVNNTNTNNINTAASVSLDKIFNDTSAAFPDTLSFSVNNNSCHTDTSSTTNSSHQLDFANFNSSAVTDTLVTNLQGLSNCTNNTDTANPSPFATNTSNTPFVPSGDFFSLPVSREALQREAMSAEDLLPEDVTPLLMPDGRLTDGTQATAEDVLQSYADCLEGLSFSADQDKGDSKVRSGVCSPPMQGANVSPSTNLSQDYTDDFLNVRFVLFYILFSLFVFFTPVSFILL